MKRIHDSLHAVLENNRYLFWYDDQGEWLDVYETFSEPDIVKLKVENNEFGTKVRLVRESNANSKFLIYIPTHRPMDSQNWLLDFVLQGYEYRADQSSLTLQEVGLSKQFLSLVKGHIQFFKNSKRIQAFKGLITPGDQDTELRLKMMAILAGAPASVDALLLRFLKILKEKTTEDPIEDPIEDPVKTFLGSSNLVEYFWKDVDRNFGYNAQSPTMRDFTVWLFRGANPLDQEFQKRMSTASVFLRNWKDSIAHQELYQEWAHKMQKELNVKGALEDHPEQLSLGMGLGDCDTFEIFEKFSLHLLYQAFEKGMAAGELRSHLDKRRHSVWYKLHESGYCAIQQALELRELMASAEVRVDSIETGFNRYVNNWWRIDRAYRLCALNLRRYGQVQFTEKVSQWVEKNYVNNFLLPLTDQWSDQVRELDTWDFKDFKELEPQRCFYQKYVLPFRKKDQKVFVIVSDALRFESAADFAQELYSLNRWTAKVEALMGSLPTYTQLGMASLLPGKELAVEADTSRASVDGHDASGIVNRSEILGIACGGRATALSTEDFLQLNSVDGKSLTRDHDVIYIFHNVIDAVGDKPATEVKTFEAVKDAFDELNKIIKYISNFNGNNILLTADHGFLFQQDAVAAEDMTPMPHAQEWTFESRRFALGRGISDHPAVKVFSSTALGVQGDWSAAVPLSLGRFPLQGSGKRFVHGGSSLQELVIPVVKIHKNRTDDTSCVEVRILHLPPKITTGQVSVKLYQVEPAMGKVLPRNLRVGVFSEDGTCLSEIKTFVFDSKSSEARLRETSILLSLSHLAERYNQQNVEFRMEEKLLDTEQTVLYKKQSLKMQKYFGSDFDEN